MDTLAPDEAVVPMIMSKILVAFEGRIRFRRVVASRRRRHDRCTRFKIERDKVLEANGMAGINTAGKRTVPPPIAAAAAIARFTAGVSRVLPSAVAPNDLTSNAERPSGSCADECWTQPAANTLAVVSLRNSLRRMSTRVAPCMAMSLLGSRDTIRSFDHNIFNN